MSEAWQYCENLSDPEAVKKLVQAALQTFLTLKEALQDRDVDPERFATFYDWPRIQAQLHAALKGLCCTNSPATAGRLPQ